MGIAVQKFQDVKLLTGAFDRCGINQEGCSVARMNQEKFELLAASGAGASADAPLLPPEYVPTPSTLRKGTLADAQYLHRESERVNESLREQLRVLKCESKLPRLTDPDIFKMREAGVGKRAARDRKKVTQDCVGSLELNQALELVKGKHADEAAEARCKVIERARRTAEKENKDAEADAKKKGKADDLALLEDLLRV
ncbi:hypothetical protein T492DRAFT_834724 [Pavlovales sp. CCMP2436]|nr:hypothetical protein T492DRAFT_834724 [Pavlovales sp. CCMP2436]